MSDTPTASTVILGRWEKPGNLANIAALAAAGQVTILPHELIRTTDGRVYHWTTSALEIVSAPVHHGTVADVAALDGIYLLPSCTRGVHPGDTAYVTAVGCEYRVTSGVNATATWSACATLPTIPTTPSEVGADPAGTAAAAVSAHNTATDSHADLRTALAGKQDAGNFAGSPTPGGAATTALACTGNAATATTAASCTGNSATATTASSCSGNAATATTLATARTLTIGSTGKTFNGSANVSWTLAEMGAAQKPSTGTWTPVLTADTPPTGVVLQQVYADFFILEGWCWCTFGFLVSNPGTGGSGRIKINGLPFTATSAYTGLARPQFAVNHNATVQLYQIPPGASYIYATGAVPQYQSLTVNSYIQGQCFFKTA